MCQVAQAGHRHKPIAELALLWVCSSTRFEPIIIIKSHERGKSIGDASRYRCQTSTHYAPRRTTRKPDKHSLKSGLTKRNQTSGKIEANLFLSASLTISDFGRQITWKPLKKLHWTHQHLSKSEAIFYLSFASNARTLAFSLGPIEVIGLLMYLYI